MISPTARRRRLPYRMTAVGAWIKHGGQTLYVVYSRFFGDHTFTLRVLAWNLSFPSKQSSVTALLE